jgi:hypothetical protein
MTKEDKIAVEMLLQLNLLGAGYVIPMGYARVPDRQVTRA